MVDFMLCKTFLGKKSRHLIITLKYWQASLRALLVKNLHAIQFDPGLGRSPGEGKGYPLQYSGLKNSRPELYSPWGHKESDMTEQLSCSC